MAEDLRGSALAEAQKFLTPYLDPGEKLIWAARRSFWISLRAFPLRLFYNLVFLFILFLVFGVVILPLFFLNDFDPTVFSFLLFNFLWLTIFFLEGTSIYHQNLRRLYALSNRRAFFAATRPFVEIDAISLLHLSDNKIQTLGATGSVIFPYVQRWGRTQFAFQRRPRLGFFAIPSIVKAAATLQATLDQSSQIPTIFREPIETVPLSVPRDKSASLFKRPSILSVEKILRLGVKESETIEWVGRPQIRNIIFSLSFLIRFCASLFLTGFIFLSMAYRKIAFSASDFFMLLFVIFIWLYALAPIVSGLLQTYALSNHRLYIIRGWTKLTIRIIDLVDLGGLQFIHRGGNTGSIGFGILNQQFSFDKKPVLFLNRFGFFHIEKMDEIKTRLQDAIRKARSDGSPTPSTPSADRESPAPRGG